MNSINPSNNSIAKIQRALESSFLGLPTNLSDAYYHATDTYPFYDILQDEGGENIILQIALAGWNKDDIKVETKRDQLTIIGNVNVDEYEVMNDKFRHVHKGISQKNFEKTFTLGADIVVDDADMKNGILSVTMHREVPEKDKPRLLKL